VNSAYLARHGDATGHFGMLEAEDDPAVFRALLEAAEDWLKGQGMRRALGPFNLSINEECGLLVEGFQHPPSMLMGHAKPYYAARLEALGYRKAKDLICYHYDAASEMPPAVAHLLGKTARAERLKVRALDFGRYEADLAIIMEIFNDAWSDNWGFVPLTDDEIAHVGTKLKPIVFEDLIMIAEVEGEPVAFMITLPDLNEAIMPLNGSLLPFGWARLLWWLRKPRVRTMRVPLMGVVKRFQASRLASQVAFMMIECIRRESVARYGASRAEIGWILEDNRGMRAIASAIDSAINREYVIYEKTL
jgi:hypothetical protein